MTRKNDSDGEGELRLDRRAALKAAGVGLLATGLGGSAAAQERFPPSDRTQWGRPVRMGDGMMATFFTRRRSVAPRYLGIWFTADALDGLPEEQSEEAVTALALPTTATNATNFEWASVDWAPHGHSPVDVYDVPHFDVHFYTMDRETVQSEIPAGECDADDDGSPDLGVPCEVQERGIEPLPDAQRAPGYVSTEETVPFMGNHWVNQNSPEFQGEPFTHTWIYGSFDGQITFLEPMVTLDFLRNLEGREVEDVATPEAFPEAGYYPTQYVVRYLRRQDAYAIVLRRFRQFDSA